MDATEVYLYQQTTEIGYHTFDAEIKSIIKNAVSIARPGNKVVIKPNFVRQCSLNSNEWEHVITSPHLIREVLMALIEQLDNSGEIIVLDAPQEDSDFKKIIENTGLLEIINELQKTTKVKLECIDIRIERKITSNGIIVKRVKQLGDPKGYKIVNLKTESCFEGKKCKDYYGADYDREAAKNYHNEADNSYVISSTILGCDVYINMPKLKTHKIGGMTCCLKNAVGIIGVKNCIPHHTLGSPASNGDAYPQMDDKSKTEDKLKMFAHGLLNKNIPLVGFLIAFGKHVSSPFLGKPMKVIRSGHWYGNDTLWRAILDLNRILIYADKDGSMQINPQRKYISIIDAIVAGERNGPMMPESKKCGVIGIAYSPLLGDVVMSRIMGFDYQKIPSILNGFLLGKFTLNYGVNAEEITIGSNNAAWAMKVSDICYEQTFKFKPAFGWENHIELERSLK